MSLKIEPRLLRISEAAAYCGMCVQLFKRECPVVGLDVGGVIRFDKKQLDDWIDRLGHGDPASNDNAEYWLAKVAA